MSILAASVILKWFVREEDSDQALKIREKFYNGATEIVVPDLLLIEVANALRYNPTFTIEEIHAVLGTLLDMEIEIITPTYPFLCKMAELAKGFDVTCYDAAYLALAEELGFEFITADDRFYRKVIENVKLKVSIKLLANLKW